MTVKFHICLTMILFMVVLSLPPNAAAGERTLVINMKPESGMDSMKKHRVLMEERFSDIASDERKARWRILEAARRVRTATTKREKDYYRVEYIEQRALHCKVFVVHLIKVLRDNDRFIEETERIAWQYREIKDSSQIAGMQALMLVVLDARADETKKIKYENTSAEDLIRELHRNSQLLLIANLVAPPTVAGTEYRARLDKVKTGMLSDLKALRGELSYLLRKLDKIKG